MPDALGELQRFWDADAATYDSATGHRPRDSAVLAAWRSALGQLLPSPPARVLDVGAGTGFLSLLAAQLGCEVTALDLSAGMLAQLRRSAERQQLKVEAVVGPADAPPAGRRFDAVMERHLLWTLPDPGKCLAVWRDIVPEGRLVLFESVWGSVDAVEAARSQARSLLRRLRHDPPDHHAEYPASLRRTLPLGTGTAPSRLVELAEQAGWNRARLVRLADVEWAERLGLPWPERALGAAPRFAVVAS